MLLHPNLSNGVLSFLRVSFTAEIAAVAMVAGGGDGTRRWFLTALSGCLQRGLESSLPTHSFKDAT